MSQRTRSVLLVVAAALGLALVSAALAATIASDDGDSRPSSSRGRNLPPTPVADGAAFDELPRELRERIEALPERLREQVLRAIEEGRMAGRALEDLLGRYESRNRSVLAGSVVAASDTKLTVEVYSSGERVDIAIDDETVLRRGRDSIKGSDLQRDELVLVLSMDGGKTASSVTAFGISPP